MILSFDKKPHINVYTYCEIYIIYNKISISKKCYTCDDKMVFKAGSCLNYIVISYKQFQAGISTLNFWYCMKVKVSQHGIFGLP